MWQQNANVWLICSDFKLFELHRFPLLSKPFHKLSTARIMPKYLSSYPQLSIILSPVIKETIIENYNQSNCRVVESLPNWYIYNTTAAPKDLTSLYKRHGSTWLLTVHRKKKRGIRDENCLATKKQKLKTCKFGLYSQYKTMQTKQNKPRKEKKIKKGQNTSSWGCCLFWREHKG